MNKEKFDSRLFINNKNFEYIKEEYIKLFCKKQKCYLEFQSGDILCFGDNYFNLDDIIFDLNNNCKKGLIFQWQNEGIDAHMKYPNLENINYYSYNMGLRYDFIIKQYLDECKEEKKSSKKSKSTKNT